jgi:quercetin dioxygenase-like cupin family protein
MRHRLHPRHPEEPRKTLTDFDRTFVLTAKETELPINHVAAVVNGKQSQGAYALVKYTLNRGPAPHVHEHEDESIYVISGEILLRIGSKKYELTDGDFAFMPRKVPHAFDVVSETFSGLSVSAPGGVFDKIVDDIARERASGRVLSDDDLWDIRAKYGMTRVAALPPEDEGA